MMVIVLILLLMQKSLLPHNAGCQLLCPSKIQKAFKPHKLGTRGSDRTVLRMSLFSNTVMITIHLMRKCSSFSGCKTISFSLFSENDVLN